MIEVLSILLPNVCPNFFSFIIDNWSGIDKEKATKYVLDSVSYEGKHCYCFGACFALA